MSRLAALVFGAALLAAPLAAHAQTVAADRPDAASDEGGLWMMMERSEHEAAVSPLRVTDPQLNAYVKGIMCKLSAEQCAKVRLYIMEVPHFNAYMMANGAMVVWTGLLLHTENEAQLAYILGHEMTHFAHKHQLAQMERVISTSNVMAFFSVVTAGVGFGLVGTAAELAAIGNLYAYARDQEREADAGGFELGVAAGYDPREASRTWQAMIDEHKANPRHKDKDLFFATHPTDEDRMKTLGDRAAQLSVTRTDWAANDAAYRSALAPFLLRWLDDEINRGEPEESVVLLQRLVAADPASGLFRYYLGVAYRKRGQPDDLKSAADCYAQAIAAGNAPAAAWRDQGMLAMKGGDKAAARDDFTRYLAAAPTADDKAMIQFYLTQLAGT